MASSCGTRDEGHEPPPPAELGPFPVGVTTRVLVDDSRPEELTPDDPEDLRVLVTEIWYPAASSVRGRPKSTFSEFILERDLDLNSSILQAGFGLSVNQVQELFDTPLGAVRDAALADGNDFAVVVFSHGLQASRVQIFRLAEHLASHGFVVVAPDHTYSAASASLPAGPAAFDGSSLARPDIRVQDLSFVLDELEAIDGADPEGLFTGKLATDHVGLAGVSLGGATILEAVGDDDRFVVGAGLMPVPISAMPQDRPLLYVLGEKDETIPSSSIEALYADSAGPRALLRLPDAGHLSLTFNCFIDPEFGNGCGLGFLDADLAHEIGAFYLTALYGRHLARIEQYAAALTATPYAEATLDVDGIAD